MKNYMKKIAIMFVMTLAIIGVGAIQNGAVANAATIGQQLLQPEDGWTRYDNTDNKIVYGGVWTSFSLQDGSYNNSESRSISDKNPYYEFKFYGTKFRLISTLGSSNTSNIQLTVDGVSCTYSEYINSQLKCALEFEKTDLSMGTHIVKVQKMTTDSTYLTLDAIDIGSDGKLIPYDESISLDKSSIDLTPGDTEQLTVTTTPASVGVIWASSDASVATVDQTGKVTSIKKGQATITATTTDEYEISASCVVNVSIIDQNQFVPITRKINNKGLSGDINLTLSDLITLNNDTNYYVSGAGTLVQLPTNFLVGEIKDYAGSVAPQGFLICDGSAISRTKYASLFAVIGTTYGSGDGSTTFNLPDFRGRVGVGSDAAQTEFSALGKIGGEKTHKLTVAEMPSHNHNYTDRGATSWNAASSGFSVTDYADNVNGNYTTGNAGGDQAHNNLQPYIVVNKIIYAGV